VSFAAPAGAGNDTITIAGVLNGARVLGSDTYVTTDGTTASFAASTVALSGGNTIVTVSLASTCSGTCTFGTQASAVNFSFLAAATITDVVGLTPYATARNFSIRMF